jgi:hypothetical protein
MEQTDPFEQAEIEAAAAEARQIGGVAGDEDLPDAERAVREAGGGEAEGFEQAEEQLIEHASHGDQHSGRIGLYDAGRQEEEAAQNVEYGEADHEHANEGEEDR